jgi:phosphatidylserine/phosphatidylglycerophosphate/cardiolipin synthase-like enzyme
VALLAAGDVTFETSYARPAAGQDDPAILDRLTRMIDDTPAGAEIHATVFRLTVESVRDALVAAGNRGVAVHVVHNGRDVVSEVAATLSRPAPDGLGDRHRWSGPAYDPTGRRPDFGAVATGPGSDLHTKLFLFSATRDPAGALRRDVSWWSSANLSHHSGMQKSNDAIAVYDDPVLYAGFRTRLWKLMWRGTHFAGNDFYDAGRGRGWFLGSPAARTKVFCSPQQSTDLWVGRLGSVVVDDRTEVVLAQARFTDDRLAVAEQLVRIAAGGGSVRVLVGTEPDLLGPSVRELLLTAGIAVRQALVHDKLGLVHSRHGVSRRPRKVVLSGSHNLNRDANWVNDEILVKTFHDGLYDDVLVSHVEPLWAGAEVIARWSRTHDGQPERPGNRGHPDIERDQPH